MGHTEPSYYDVSMELPTVGLGAKHLIGSPTHHTTPNNGHNLIRSTSRRLHLPLTPTHFGSKGTARIRCVARIFPLFWQDGDEKKIDHKNSSSHNRVGGSGNKHHNSHNINANIPSHPQHTFNEVDDGPENHQQFRLGSLYKGEALVQSEKNLHLFSTYKFLILGWHHYFPFLFWVLSLTYKYCEI